MLSCFNAFSIFTSRMAVIGNPFSSASVLIRLRATTSPVTLSAPTNTLLFIYFVPPVREEWSKRELVKLHEAQVQKSLFTNIDELRIFASMYYALNED